MLGVFIKVLLAIWPYLKEAFFGKSPIPTVIDRNRTASLLVLFLLITIGFFLVMVDVSLKLYNQKEEAESKVSELELRVAGFDEVKAKAEIDRLTLLSVTHTSEIEQLKKDKQELETIIAQLKASAKNRRLTDELNQLRDQEQSHFNYDRLLP